MTKTQKEHSRRNFFAVLAGGVAAGAGGGIVTGFTSRALFAQSPAHDTNPRLMSSRAAKPEDLEMTLDGFREYITPIDQFFVRTHVYVPAVNLNDWRLKIDGEVTSPLTLTMDELRRMPAVDLVAVVECAGNGRSFFNPPVPGLQWSNGSVGNARWRGVRLADVLKRAGIKSSGIEVLFDGADVPLGTMQDFRRTITVRKALDPNTLLAYEMNGETIPVKHGFPLRLVAPGWASDSWVKWVTQITVLDKEFDGFWMKNAYRKPDIPLEPGSSYPADKMKPVTSLRVKSVITSPRMGSSAAPGRATMIQGVAWSGDTGPVTGVQVSTDNGRTWKLANLKPDQFTEFGWRQWEMEWTPRTEGYYTIIARANDANGNTQPFQQEWNPSGYGWNVAPSVGVRVEPPPTMPGETLPGPPPGEPVYEQQPAGYKSACLVCHGEDVIRQQRLTPAQWDREITKMVGWGAEFQGSNRQGILDYLASRFGPRK